MQIEHTQCGICGRKLKTVKSIKDGFGPVCKKKFEAGKASKQLTLEEEIERSSLSAQVSKGVAENGDVHVIYASANEVGRHEIKHAVSTDNEKTWTFTPKEEIQKVVEDVFKLPFDDTEDVT